MFASLLCVKLDDGQELLAADMSIDCNASNRSRYVIYSLIMLIVYVVGVPTAYMVLLFRARRRICPPVEGSESMHPDKVLSKQLEIRESDRSLEHLTFLFEVL